MKGGESRNEINESYNAIVKKSRIASSTNYDIKSRVSFSNQLEEDRDLKKDFPETERYEVESKQPPKSSGIKEESSKQDDTTDNYSLPKTAQDEQQNEEIKEEVKEEEIEEEVKIEE